MFMEGKELNSIGISYIGYLLNMGFMGCIR